MTDRGDDRLLRLEAENQSLKARIQQLEDELSCYRSNAASPSPAPEPATGTATPPPTLEPPEYLRYGRQLILPQIGLPGQKRLKSCKVLIVGVGGLGCPAATYLAAAGVGTLGLVDHDTVELSNLHRQTLHTTARIGTPKVHSAIAALRERNPHVAYVAHAYALTRDNALATVAAYDVVLDCTDHPSLRYLLSDTCVLARKPLVSASALRTDGQLIVLNSPPAGAGAPCYRCIWPRPPPPVSVTSCGEGGVLGPVVGVMGVLQALQTIRLIVARPAPPPVCGEVKHSSMLIFSAFDDTPFRVLRLRGRRKGCVACADGAEAPKELPPEVCSAFCGKLSLLKPQNRRTVEQVRREDQGNGKDGKDGESGVARTRKKRVLVDVRDETQFGICSLPGSLNIPFDQWNNCTSGGVPQEMIRVLEKEQGEREEELGEVVMLCRHGNDSQVAAKQLLDSGLLANGTTVVDVIGGITQWAKVAPQDGVVEY